MTWTVVRGRQQWGEFDGEFYVGRSRSRHEAAVWTVCLWLPWQVLATFHRTYSGYQRLFIIACHFGSYTADSHQECTRNTQFYIPVCQIFSVLVMLVTIRGWIPIIDSYFLQAGLGHVRALRGTQKHWPWLAKFFHWPSPYLTTNLLLLEGMLLPLYQLTDAGTQKVFFLKNGGGKSHGQIETR